MKIEKLTVAELVEAGQDNTGPVRGSRACGYATGDLWVQVPPVSEKRAIREGGSFYALIR